MSLTLQEQLMALGIATEDQMRDTRPKNKSGPRPGPKKKKARSGKPRRNNRTQDSTAAAPLPHSPTRDTNKRRAHNEPSPEEKALRQRVHKMIADTQEPRGEDAQVPFHFVKGSRVKRIYVTEDQQQRLSANELAVAAMKGRHYVIPIATARKVRELIPPYFISMGDAQADIDLSDVDDEYSDFQVPDDLMW